MQGRDPDAFSKLQGDAGHEVEAYECRGGVRAKEPQREEDEDARDPKTPHQPTRDEALDEQGDERRARVHGRVELAEEVFAVDAGPDGGLVQAQQIEEVGEL